MNLKQFLIVSVLITSILTYGLTLETYGSGSFINLALDNFFITSTYDTSLKPGFGIRFFDQYENVERIKLGFINVSRKVDRSYYEIGGFYGENYGIYLNLGYESFSIPSTSFEKNYIISKSFISTLSTSKTWLSLPAIPLGDTVIGPIAFNYEDFNMKQTFLEINNEKSISFSRMYSNLGGIPLSYIQMRGTYSLGTNFFSDKSLEQGLIMGIGYDFENKDLVGVLGGRIFLGTDMFPEVFPDGIRIFFSSYAAYVPGLPRVNYTVWIKILSPIKGDLIIQNETAAFRFKLYEN